MRSKHKIFLILTLVLLLAACCIALGACGASGVQKLTLGATNNFFMVGEEFGGVNVQVTYNDGRVENLTLDDKHVAGFDTSVAGQKTVIVTYEGKSVAWDIEVSDKYVAALAVKDGSADTFVQDGQYTDGDIVLLVTYTDKSTREIPVTEEMISFSLSNVGVVPAEIEYGGLTLAHNVSVREALVTEATVGEETQTTYRYGDEFAGVTLDVTYENGKTEVAEITDVAQVEGFDTSAVGSMRLSVEYKNYGVTFEAEVLRKVLSIEAAGYKEYYEKDSPFEAGGKLTLNYHDETAEEIDITAEMIEKFDSSKYGKSSVTVGYEDLTAEFDIIVPLVTAAGEYKMQVEDETFCDLSQAESSGSKLENTTSTTAGTVSNGAEGQSTANISKVGNKIIIKFYSSMDGTFIFGTRAQSASGSGKKSQVLSAAVSVTVNGEAQTVLGTLNPASTTGANWTNMLNWTETAMTGSLDLVKGENTVVITCIQHGDIRFPNFDYFTIKTQSKISSLAVKDGSADTFVQNGKYNDGDIVLTVTYEDGSTGEVPVTADMIGLDLSALVSATAVIEYAGLTVDYPVTVRAAVVTKATVNERTKKLYLVGETFAGVVLDVTYENGLSDVVEITDASQVTGFDTVSAGEKECSLTYKDFKVDFKVRVENEIKNIKSMRVKDYTEYYAKDAPFADAVLEVTYEDGTTDDVTVTADMLKNFDTSTYGRHTVTVTYREKTADFDIAVALVTAAGEYKIQAEDETFCDYSQAQLQNGAKSPFEDVVAVSTSTEKQPNGAEGYGTANISKVGNKIIIRFNSAIDGTFVFGARAQSASNSGTGNQEAAKAISLTVNEKSETAIGTFEAASTTGINWKDMTHWSTLDITGSVALVKGENTIVIECIAHATIRFPNFDYFTLKVA